MEELILAIGDIIVGIDIGSSKISLVVGEVNNFNQVELVYTVEHKCKGIKKTKIIDEDEIANAIVKSIQDAEREAEIKINSAYLTIAGKYVTIVQNSITKDVKDKYSGISIRDVQTAIMQVKDIEIPEGEYLICPDEKSFFLYNKLQIYNARGTELKPIFLNSMRKKKIKLKDGYVLKAQSSFWISI